MLIFLRNLRVFAYESNSTMVCSRREQTIIAMNYEFCALVVMSAFKGMFDLSQSLPTITLKQTDDDY